MLAFAATLASETIHPLTQGTVRFIARLRSN